MWKWVVGAIIAAFLLTFPMVYYSEGASEQYWGKKLVGGSGPIIGENYIGAGMHAWYQDFNENGKVDKIRIIAFFDGEYHILREFNSCREYNIYWDKQGFPELKISDNFICE